MASVLVQYTWLYNSISSRACGHLDPRLCSLGAATAAVLRLRQRPLRRRERLVKRLTSSVLVCDVFFYTCRRRNLFFFIFRVRAVSNFEYEIETAVKV